ncbi:MAG: formate dehydrogenase accessory sulfurtransferase FdhD [Methanospirillum sp.]|nr:formate dehydrogenase accessory sulfurtransferase FdhD [Methanospirillum sp.]
MNRITCYRIGRAGKKPVPEGCSAYDESPTAVFINGRHAATVLVKPGDSGTYVTGYLFSEQYIKKLDEIESIRVEKNRVSVITTNIFTSPGPKKTILSGCGGSVSYIDTTKLPVLHDACTIACDDLFSAVLVSGGSGDEPERSLVFASLWTKTKKLVSSTDLGDDQALDRMIGSALIEECDFSGTYCLFSGCITSEIVRKCLVAQIPLILTTGTLTTLAVHLAEKNGLCMALLDEDDMLVCSHQERIR